MYDDVGTHQRKRNEGTIDPALLRWMQGSNIPMKTIITGKNYKSVRFINDFWFSVCIPTYIYKISVNKKNTKPLVFRFKKKLKTMKNFYNVLNNFWWRKLLCMARQGTRFVNSIVTFARLIFCPNELSSHRN